MQKVWGQLSLFRHGPLIGPGLLGFISVAAVTSVVILTVAGGFGGTFSSRQAPNTVVRTEASGSDLLESFERLPVAFVENHGQTSERVSYYAQGPQFAFHLTPNEIVLSFMKEPGSSSPGVTGPEADFSMSSPGPQSSPIERMALDLEFLGSNPDVTVEGAARTPGQINYFRGNDPSGWHTGMSAFQEVVYRGLWPGIDMALQEQDGQLKYEFRVAPGARVADIQLAYEGADDLLVDGSGELLIQTPWGALRDSAPVTYQQIGGRRVPVESRYSLRHGKSGDEYAFLVGDYRPDRELIIDPGVQYSTFLGGSSNERGDGIAVDDAGNVYIVGTTQSSDLPTTAGAVDRTFNGGVVDVFVSKLNANGSGLVYSTYLGGTPTPLQRGTGDPFEFGREIAVDGNGNAYLTGQTTSSDFPTTAGAFDQTINVSDRDATDGFVTKLNSSGGLSYSTFLGGTTLDDPDGITVDGSGSAYVTGFTTSSDFPTTPGAFDTSHAGGNDAFVTKLNGAGSALVYSTFLGGTDNELGKSIKVDAGGNAFVAGGTRSAEFPTTAGAFDTTHNGGDFATLFDAFVTKLNSDGSALVYSTFLGGSNTDTANGLDIDAAGNAYVVGGALSPEFPTTPGAFDTTFTGSSESFVTKLNAAGSNLVYSTFMGGGGGAAIALDSDDGAWVTGAASAGAPTTADAFDSTNNGSTDAHLAKLAPNGSALEYATFFGGTEADPSTGVAVDAARNVYVTGTTYSDDFPTTGGAFDRSFGGDPLIFWGDAFVTKFGDGAASPPPPPAERTTTNFSGRVDRNQTVSHSLAIDGTGPVDVSLDWNDSRANLTLRALGPSGGTVFSATGNAKPKQGEFTAAATGSYRFEVTNTTRRSANYTLSVTHPVATSTPPVADTTDPTVSITSPTGGSTVSGSVSISATASDNVGVSEVRFFLDGTQVGSDSTSPYSISWNSTSVADGAHSVSARALDAAGNAGDSALVSITVSNPSAPSSTLASLGLTPATVTGGDNSTGTVTLTSAAPAGGASVALISSNTDVATVPASVNVPAGSTSATFTVSTSPQNFDASSAISATFGGTTRTVILSVTPAASTTDTVSISRAEYDGGKNELRVEASSSSSGATLRVHVTATNALIGTLSGGRGEFSWPTNPQNITVRSSLGGSASRSVTAK